MKSGSLSAVQAEELLRRRVEISRDRVEMFRQQITVKKPSSDVDFIRNARFWIEVFTILSTSEIQRIQTLTFLYEVPAMSAIPRLRRVLQRASGDEEVQRPVSQGESAKIELADVWLDHFTIRGSADLVLCVHALELEKYQQFGLKAVHVADKQDLRLITVSARDIISLTFDYPLD